MTGRAPAHARGQAAPACRRSTMSISVTRLFGLEGDRWLRHANPVSVWTRFAVLPLLALAIWSREWIGWWSLAAVALVLVFMMVNPLLFPPPRSTRNWASKGVFGERGGGKDRKSTRLNSSHTVIYTLSLHDALPICPGAGVHDGQPAAVPPAPLDQELGLQGRVRRAGRGERSEEHTSELQSHSDLHSFPTRRSSDLPWCWCS